MSGLVLLFPLLLVFSRGATLAAVHADANPPAIFAFGDVLSDVGNNNALPDGFHADHPYYGIDFPGGVATGRFTNGYNLVDIIARHMGFEQSPPAYLSPTKGSTEAFRGVNFASGGSGPLIPCTEGDMKRCFTMSEQMDFFKRTAAELPSLLGGEASCRQLISNSIFVITGGGYDINEFFIGQLATFGSTIDSFVANMTSTFRDQLRELYDHGARKFAVINVQPMGLSPEADVQKPTVDVKDILNGYVWKFNEAEYLMLKELSSTLPGMKFSVGNLYAALTDLISHPEEHGMKNVTRPCCGEVHWSPTEPHIQGVFCWAEAPCCPNRSEYVYWDRLHPTQAALEYAGGKFYGGNLAYAKPINLKQLVGYESSGRGVSSLQSAVGAM